MWLVRLSDNGKYRTDDPDYKFPNFHITLPNLGFELDKTTEDSGGELTISMKDGYCGGRDFKVHNITKKEEGGVITWDLEVERCADDTLSLMFPYSDRASRGEEAIANEPYQIQTGDHYVLTGINITETSYIWAASVEALRKAIRWLLNNDYTRFTYLPKVDEKYMKRQDDAIKSGHPAASWGTVSLHDTLKAGMLMAFQDSDLNVEGSVFIDQLTIKEDGDNGIPTYDVVLRNDKQVGTLQRVQNQINSLSSYVAGGGGGDGMNTSQIRSLIKAYGGENFLSKVSDDIAQGVITFAGGLVSKVKAVFEDGFSLGTSEKYGADGEGNATLKSVGGADDDALTIRGGANVESDLNVGGNVEITGQERVDRIQSHNYSGSGLADTGYLITNDNGSGSSLGIFDYLTIRKKMIVNSLEIKETHFTAGDVAQTLASAEIARTDYFYVDEVSGKRELLGYSSVLVPWSLKNRLLALAKGDLRGIFGHYKQVRMTLTTEELMRCNRIRCYFLAKDGERSIENWFRPNDLVRCQTWNVLKTQRETFIPDFEEHDGNVYWWRKAHDVSWNTGVTRYVAKDAQGNPTDQTTTNPNQAYVNEGGVERLYDNGIYHTDDTDGYDSHQPVTIEGNTYHWFEVDYDYYNETGIADVGSDIPAAGDKVVQFGNVEDPDRMNIILQEVNGSGNPDAPDIKMFRGVYSFNLDNCWWGGSSSCKAKFSISTGIEIHAPYFKWVTEYGTARQIVTRPEQFWTEIALERDDWTNQHISDIATYYPNYSDDIVDNEGRFQSRGGFVIENGQKRYGSAVNPIPKNYVRKCRYYEQVSHSGSIWLTTFAEGWYWRDKNGNAINKQEDGATHERTYTTQEPTPAATHWTLQVEKGDSGVFKSSVFCRSNGIPATPSNEKVGDYNTYDNPIPPEVSGQPTWSDGIPEGNAIVWMSTAWFDVNGIQGEWTSPRQQTDTETLDIEFSPNTNQPSAPYNISVDNRGNGTRYGTYGTNSRANGSGQPADWYDPALDGNNAYVSWDNMKWRAERKISNGEYIGTWTISRIKGENAVRIDLTNENDTMLYSSSKGLVSGSVTSTAYMFDGASDVSSNTTFSISARTGVTTTQATISGRTVTVTGMNSATAKVTVQGVYTDQYGITHTKTTILSLKKIIDGDKYELIVKPNSIAYNTTKNSPASSTLSIEVYKTSCDGIRALSAPPTGYGVYANNTALTAGSTGTYSYTTTNSAISSVLVRIADTAAQSEDLDSETIPVNKSTDGAAGKNGEIPAMLFTQQTAGTSVTRPTCTATNYMNNSLPSGWSKSAPSRSTGYDLWMSQNIVLTSTSGAYSLKNTYWSTPVKISGDKGDPGADSADREWIYIGASEYSNPYSGTHPKNITKDKDGTQRTSEYIHSTDDFVPYGWQDTAIATDDTNNKFVYASWRDKAKGSTTWGDFTDPILWSNWGVQGIDGDGVQYIYKLFSNVLQPSEESSNIPTNATQNADGEWMPSSSDPNSVNYGWDDDPLTPTAAQPYCYCSVIKKLNGEWQKSGNYGKFEKLGLWSKWTKDADVWTIGNDGYWYKNGVKQSTKAEGTDGTGVEIKGSVAQESDMESTGYVTPVGGTRVMADKGDCYICNSNRHLYMWDSAVWVDLGEFQGEPGENSYMHIAYADTITLSNGVVTAVTGFTVVNAGKEYDWWGFCTNNEEQDPGAGASSTDVTAARNYKWNYMRGKDGNGYERVYLFCKDGFTPTINQSSGSGSPSDDEFLPNVGNYDSNYCRTSRWTDDPEGNLSATWSVLWWSERKRIINDSTGKGSWGTFSTPAIHNTYTSSPWVADLDNEMDSIACDSNNKPVKQQTVTTNVMLFYGSQRKAFTTAVTGYTNGTASSGITVSWGNTSAATADDNDTITVVFATTATVDGNKDFEITLTAKDDNTIQRKLILTVNGLKGGATYNLVPSDYFVVYNKNKQYVPSTLTCTYNKFDVAKGAYVTASGGTIKFMKDGDTTETAYSAALTPGTDFTEEVTFLLYVGTTLVDRETIHIVKDGIDGMSVPSYLETQEAWSNAESVASAATEPTPNSGWSDSTPPNTAGYAYLWRRSRQMTLKEDKSGYNAGNWTYTRLSGTNGTSIKTQGNVANTSKLLDKKVIPLVNGSDGPQTNVEDGWAYVCEADRHLYQWSDELRSKSGSWVDWHSGWLDLGEFKGESGKTYYTHIAWAKGIILKVDGDGRAITPSRTTGQRTIPNAVYPMSAAEQANFDFSIAPQEDLDWMGTLIDEDSNDATDYKYYTWKYVKGDTGDNSVRIDLDNQADLVSLDSEGKVRFARDIVVRARIYDGAVPQTSGVTNTTSESLVIGGCTPTTSLSNGVLTITWSFRKGMVAAATKKTIKLTYGDNEYSAVFSLGTTDADAIWQVLPNPSEISFSKTSSNTLTPQSITSKCGYTQSTGSGTDSVSAAIVDSNGQITVSNVGKGMYLYYRSKTVDNGTETWGNWTKYVTAGISVANSTNVTDYEYCITEGAMNNNQTNIIDRECVPVVKDGINGDPGLNSVRLALDNEHEDFLYDGTTLVAPSGGASSPIRLYDGINPITDFTPSIDWNQTSGVANSTSGAYIASRVLYVKGLTAATAAVVVKVTYNNSDYYAKFTANKTNQDKYDIVVSPSSVAYNPASYQEQTIQVSATGIGIGGTPLTAAECVISTTENSGKLRLFWAYVNANGSLSDKTRKLGTSFSLTANECANYAGLYIELRYYADATVADTSTSYRLCDYETVEIAKVLNGNSGQSVYTATAFKRATTKPSATGGSYSTGKPSEAGWEDGWPTGSDPVWMAQRIFTSDGLAPQGSAWMVSLAQDSESQDIEFSPVASSPGNPTTNPSNWYDPVDDPTADWENMIWMATRQRIVNASGNPDWSEWVVIKIKGEAGGQTSSKESWFRAETTRIDPPTPLNSLSNPTNYYQGQDTSWGENKKYLYRADRYYLTDGTYFWDGPYFYSEWADQGPAGPAAINVKLIPENVIITQSDVMEGSAYPLEVVDTLTVRDTIVPVYGKTKIEVWEGDVEKTNFTIGTPTSSRCTVVKDNDGITVGISAVGTDSSTGNYYQNGEVVIPVTYDGHTYNVRFNFYCNLLGNWKERVIVDTKTEIGNSTWFDVDANGNIVESDSLGTFIRSSKQNTSQLNEDSYYYVGTWTNNSVVLSQTEIDTYGSAYTLVFDMTLQGSDVNLEQVNVSFQKTGGVGRTDIVNPWGTYKRNFTLTAGTWNILVKNVSTGADVNCLISNAALYVTGVSKTSVLAQNVESITARVSNSEGNISQLQITADSIESVVAKGKNLLKGSLSADGWTSVTSPTDSSPSAAISDGNSIKCATYKTWLVSPTVSVEKDKTYVISFYSDASSGITVRIGFEIALTTENRSGRHFVSFTPSRAVSGKVYINTSVITYPQLEVGTTPTEYSSETADVSSHILQTADSIELMVKNGLNDVGISILGSSNKIVAKAGTFEVQNSSGGKTFEIDSDGNLKSYGSTAAFSGRIIATGGTIGGFNITTTQINSTGTTPNIELRKDGSAKLGGFEVATNATASLKSTLTVGNTTSQRIEIIPFANNQTGSGSINFINANSDKVLKIGFYNDNYGVIDFYSPATDQNPEKSEVSVRSNYLQIYSENTDNRKESYITMLTSTNNAYSEYTFDDKVNKMFLTSGVEGGTVMLRAHKQNGTSAWPRVQNATAQTPSLEIGRVQAMTIGELLNLISGQAYYTQWLSKVSILVAQTSS